MSRTTVIFQRFTPARVRRIIALVAVVPLLSGGLIAGSALTAQAAGLSTTVTTDVELAAAFAAASGAGNIVTLGADIVSGGLSVPAAATVTLKLNGKELTATGIGQRAGIAVRASSTLIVDGPGILTAQGGDSSAGIGSPVGDNTPAGDAGTIIIHGGTIHATGGNLGAGIGSGGWSVGGSISITGGTVTAQGGESAAGIGSGYNRGPGTISISGGSVIALGGMDGAGIGSGVQSDTGTLTISGGTVAATGGGRAAGLGGGYTSSGLAVSITGGSVVAGGSTGIAIGAGEDSPNFGSLSNSGILQTALGSTLRIPAGQTFANSGTFVNGGTLVVDGMLENSGSLSGGVVTVTGTLVNTGTLPSGIAINVPALTVHFNDGDVSHGNVAVYAPTLQAVIDAGLVPERPARPDYDFVGWFTAPTGGAAWNAATTLSTKTDLYAQWLIRTYTVTFEAQGGTEVDSQRVDHGQQAIIPTPPTRAGYTFAGWTTDAQGEVAWDPTVAVTDELTLYANWKLDAVTPVATAVPATPATTTGSGLAATGWNGALPALLAFALFCAGISVLVIRRRRSIR